MATTPQNHRRPLRLQDFDYSQNGAYFVTIVTQGRRCLFGEVVNGEMVLNDAGGMVENTIIEIPDHYPGIIVEAHVVMPNHIHVMIMIEYPVRAGPRACPGQDGHPQGGAPTTKRLSLPDVVHDLKSLTTHRYMDGVHEKQWQPFPGRLWQRNYYEHIIRDEKDHLAIYDYIISNPLNWERDEEYC